MDVSGKRIEVAEVTWFEFAYFSCQSNMHPGKFERKSECKFCFFTNFGQTKGCDRRKCQNSEQIYS